MKRNAQTLWPAFGITLIAALSSLSCTTMAQTWTVEKQANPEGPGQVIDALFYEAPAARLVYGAGQRKIFLHVFGEDGAILTNPGLDASGKVAGRFPHHRGIFIGWNQIRSELGQDDLWHMHHGERMELIEVNATHTPEYAEIIAEIAWRSREADSEGSNLLISEVRTIRISKPGAGNATVIDTHFKLTAERELYLGGDLQHAGIHFRAHREVDNRASETIYQWAPDVENKSGRIINSDMRWCRFMFPFQESWYTVIQLNAPTNPTEELSWRDYGRFGFFFNKNLAKGETVELNYRFVVNAMDNPEGDTHSKELLERIREYSDSLYQDYASGY